jgi:hypothetical protein
MSDRTGFCLLLGAAAALSSFGSAARAQDLFALDEDSGVLWEVRSSDAAAQRVGSTGLLRAAGLERAPDGTLYAFTTGTGATLFAVDARTAAVRAIGPLRVGAVFEGDLAIAPDGTAWGTNQGSTLTPVLFRIDLASGAGTIVGAVSGGPHDINGLVWREDGMLIGLDGLTNALLEIDPATARSRVLAPLAVAAGSYGAMTAVDGQGYLCTAGPLGRGSNELFAVDLFEGTLERRGSFDRFVTGNGLSGLAAGACRGSARGYGRGLAGSGGFAPRVAALGCAAVGRRFAVQVRDGLGGAHGCLALGPAPAAQAFLGGALWLDVAAGVAHTMPGRGAGAGRAVIAFVVPDEPRLAGVDVFFQAFYCDPGAPMAVSMSGGLHVTIGASAW